VNLADARHRDGFALQSACIDPPLDGDVRFGFDLQVALAGVAAVTFDQPVLP